MKRKSFFLFLFGLLCACAASVVAPLEDLDQNQDGLDSHEQSNYDLPNTMELGNMIMTSMQNLFANQERALEARMKQLELFVDYTCRNSGGGPRQQTPKSDLEVHVSQMLDGFMDYMSSLTQVFADELRQQFDSKLDLVLRKIDNKFDGLSVAPTKHPESDTIAKDAVTNSNDTSETNDETSSNFSSKIEDQLKNLVTREDLKKQTEHSDEQINNLVYLLNQVPSQQLLNYTKNINHILYSFKPIYDSFTQVAANCDMKDGQYDQMERFEELLQELKGEVDDNGNILSSMYSTIKDAEDILGDKISALENLTEHMYDNTRQMPSKSSTPATTVVRGHKRDCEDSEFVGGPHTQSVCQTAVRYRKCTMQIVAYHCCRTCTDAGQLPAIGPHRYLDYPRKINLHKPEN